MQVAKEPVLLLVEDSDDDAFFFQRKFLQSGIPMSVEHVRNGGEAISFLRNAAAAGLLPRIVFLDLKMPVLNGFEVLSWIRNQSLDVPVVVLSGSEEKQDRVRALQSGAAEYLVKPISVRDYQRVLGTCMPNMEETREPQIGAKY